MLYTLKYDKLLCNIFYLHLIPYLNYLKLRQSTEWLEKSWKLSLNHTQIFNDPTGTLHIKRLQVSIIFG